MSDLPPVSDSSVIKTRTGIAGLDDVLAGGLPRSRVTLVVGAAGSGKTVLSTEFLVRGIQSFGETGVMVSFDEPVTAIATDMRSFGWDLAAFVQTEQLQLLHLPLYADELTEIGSYDLSGLFVQLERAIDRTGARRVVLDSIDAMIAGLTNERIVRTELVRLFGWLREKGITAVLTAGRGPSDGTQRALAEYVSDCVLLLDNRVEDQIATRRLRVMKYRGSRHGKDEYPFLISESGILLFPATATRLDHPASTACISSGISRLDAMLGQQGFYRGSTVLVSGTAGTGKSSLAAHVCAAACRRGERALYFSYEESEAQIVRNMRSINLDLGGYVESSLLRLHAERPSRWGLEQHILEIQRHVSIFDPSVIVLDPISGFSPVGTLSQIRSMVGRLVDFFRIRGITSVFTNLTEADGPLEHTLVAISSIADVWMVLRDIELNGERNKGLCILKARGMAHSNQIREFRFSAQGIDLLDVYLGPGGVLTGTARLVQEARDQIADRLRQQEIERRRRSVEARRTALAAQIATLQAEIARDELELEIAAEECRQQNEAAAQQRSTLARQRFADPDSQEGKDRP